MDAASIFLNRSEEELSDRAKLKRRALVIIATA